MRCACADGVVTTHVDRELKEPLIPWAVLEELVAVLEQVQGEQEQQMAKVGTIIDKMPSTNR